MTVIHIVLLKFKPEVTQELKDAFVLEFKTLKNVPYVKNGRPIVGGPSLTSEWSKGFEFAFISYHENQEALREYRTSKEHHRVTSTYIYPLHEEMTIFDFEVDPEDEHMCVFESLRKMANKNPDSKAFNNEEGKNVDGTEARGKGN